MKKFVLIFAYAAFFILPPHSWTQEPPRAMGWKPSPHGVKGAPIETHPLFKAAPLPRAASVAQWFYRTDQKDRGACVAFSGVESYDAVHQKNNNGTHAYLSFLDVYQRCLLLDGSFPNDNGTYGNSLLAVLRKGALLEKTWPYSMPLKMLPPVNNSTNSEREASVTLKSYAIPSDDAGYAVKQCIANVKIPVLVGSYWYNNGFSAPKVSCRTKDAQGKSIIVQRYVVAMPKGKPVGGHEVPIISYDDDMVFPGGEVGGVEFHNHWAGFGDERGSAWAPQKWFFNPKYADDKHAIEEVTAQGQPVTPPPPPPKPKPWWRIFGSFLQP